MDIIECAECGKSQATPSGSWSDCPGWGCLFGCLAVCSLTCAEKYAVTSSRYKSLPDGEAEFVDAAGNWLVNKKGELVPKQYATVE